MNKLIELLKVFVFVQTKGGVFHRRYKKLASRRAKLRLHDSWETIAAIVKNGSSVSRFGDGELQMVSRFLEERSSGATTGEEVDTFQAYDKALAERLYEVWQSPSTEKMLICAPYAFKDSSGYRGYGRVFFEREALLRFSLIEPLAEKQDFYDAAFTRFYLGRHDIKDYPRYISVLKQIWAGRDILFVEGEQSRLGVGNDLFENAKSIKRILCPSTNAWAVYPQILEAVRTHAEGRLVLIALGMTATVLAYDLAREEIQAIDLGHLDVEYEWYRIGAKKKVAISGKYVNEAPGGREVSPTVSDASYYDQIITTVR